MSPLGALDLMQTIANRGERIRLHVTGNAASVPRVSLVESVEAFEKDLLLDALKTTRGNCARAAKLLGTTERIFNYKVRRYSIDPKRFK